MIQEIRKVVRQQNDPKSSIAWEDSRSQLTLPPKVASPAETNVLWERNENALIDEEETSEGDEEDDEDDHQLARVLLDSSFPTSVLLHSSKWHQESPEQESLVESYSSTSTATFNRYRTRLSASTGDLAAMQAREDPWMKVGLLPFPRVRSLDDMRDLRRDSWTASDNKDKIESMELTDNLSGIWKSSYTMDEMRLLAMSKEDIVKLWQGSERALLNRLQDTLKEKRLLEQKLAFIQKTLLKPP
ncbi:uncharacterized protein LOC118205135 [Stegodyphus dumicola]|nr:uncharacterized protein LOC118205135 [Stegodyphus dumicola]